jgi:hypothetical protein
LLAAVAASFYWVAVQQNGPLSATLLEWLLFFAAPLVFVFAYPSFLFAASPQRTNGLRNAAILHGLAATVTTVLFVILGSTFWKNPMRDVDSLALLVVPIVTLSVFCVAAFFLLLKTKSTPARFAAFVFWPYWFVFSLVSLGRFFEASIFRAAFCFLCLLSSILFAFAAGAIPYRPAVAHTSALVGLVSMPWVYWTTLHDTPLGNIWTFFNVPDSGLREYNLRLAALIIVSVALIVLAIATAALRLVPARLSYRGLPLCVRTWPAFGASFLFLAVWFSQSVMPYRIPGAVDGAGGAILQILRVEKRGLQFHESCVSVWGYRDHRLSVTFSGNDHRLFEYRFQQLYASAGELQQPLTERILAVIESSASTKRRWDTVKPLRKWNVDGWYVNGENSGLKAYTTDNGQTPPQEVVELFNELEKIPRAQETHSDLKDVCLGFCYDPISGLGLLYANQRCRYDGHDYVCR